MGSGHTVDMKRFDELLAPHMDAAYNLARWLTGNESAARDVVQESALRAFRFLHRFEDGMRISAHRDRPFRYIVTDHFANA